MVAMAASSLRVKLNIKCSWTVYWATLGPRAACVTVGLKISSLSIFILFQGWTRVIACEYTPVNKARQTGNFAMWNFFASQTYDKWWLRQSLDSCDYLSWPLYDPDDQWCWHYHDPVDQSWRHLDDPDDWWWRPFDNPFYNSHRVTTSLMPHVMTLMTFMNWKYWCWLFIVPIIETRWQNGWQGDEKDN